MDRRTGKELSNIITNTAFGGTTLLSTKSDAKFNSAVTFQIGTSSDETMSLNLVGDDASGSLALLNKEDGGLLKSVTKYFTSGDTATTETTAGDEISSANANAMIGKLADAIDGVSTVRSALGAASNRLDHVYNNLANVSTNTKAATGRIMDTDFAAESSSMTSSQMLLWC